ncbi:MULTISPECIES: acyl carrier protein [Nocardiopsis]|jgi:acyl carrier protein|uniref:Acyl carrier protein n=1 Tax=Nocardiopsis alba TaxID=53437 RepID=A0A7K2IYM3_9ACTN|nr:MULTISPECIES: phosphopantetheine-binding protein [Nocardiopsis]MEC3891716.1 phosphopantetheine-binding protein [Nocardiopsis sp. LDBS1602]MYR34946.1 acyl carrier protein [Nocardiopsis alba]
MTDDIRDRIRERIVTVHAPDLAGENIPRDYDLLTSGVIDSLSLLALVEWIQSSFDVPVTDVEISPSNFRTIDAIADFIETNTGQRI